MANNVQNLTTSNWYDTLVLAIAAASASDVLEIANGTFSGAGWENVSVSTASLTFQAAAGATVTLNNAASASTIKALSGGAGLTIDGIAFTGATSEAVRIYAGGSCTITDCTFTIASGDRAVYANGNSFTASGCTLSGSASAYGFYCYGGGTISIADCVFTCGGEQIRAQTASTGTIDSCKFTPQASGTGFYGYALSAANPWVVKNGTFDGATNSANYGIRTSNGVSDLVSVYANTIDGFVDNLYLQNYAAAVVNNNITNATTFGILGVGAGQPAPDHNTFFGNATDVSTYTAPTNSQTSDPLYVGAPDYHLATGSPAIGAGTTLGAVTVDKDDEARPANPATGAYEFVSTFTSPSAPTSGTWSDWLDTPTVHTFFYLLVEGIPKAFSSATIPDSWFTGDYADYTQLHLDVADGIKVPAATLNRKSGLADVTSMRFRIGPDDLSGSIRNTFATSLASAAKARTTEALDWDSQTALSVDSSSGFHTGDAVYIGRETLKLSGVSSPDLQFLDTTAGREQYGSVRWRLPFDGQYAAGRYISTQPLTWRGRWVKLYLGVCNANGQPIDAAFGGDHQREIWRGVIGSIQAEQTWAHWTMDCRSIDSVLDTQVGAAPAKGSLDWADKAGAAGNYGATISNAYIPDMPNVTDGAKVLLRVEHPTGPIDTIHSITVGAGYYYDAARAVESAVESALNTAYPTYTFDVNRFLPKTPAERLRFEIFISGGAIDHKDWFFTLSAPPKDAVLPLLGFGAVTLRGYGDWSTDVHALEATKQMPAFAISQYAQSIPFRLLPQGPDDVFPSAGYAKLTTTKDGVENVEYIEYTGVSAAWVADGYDNVYELTGCRRGAIGSTATDLLILPEGNNTDGWSVPIGSFEVTPCIACETTTYGAKNIITYLMELAVSSGDGANDRRGTTYDNALIGQFVGGSVPEAHFDVAHIADVAASLDQNLALRRFAITEQKNLREWIGKELAALGCYLLSRQTDTGYQITIDRAANPALAATTTIGATDIITSEWPTIQPSSDVVTVVECKFVWDQAQEDFADEVTNVNARDAQLDYGVTGDPVEIESVGMQGLPQALIDAAVKTATKFFAAYSLQYEIVRISVNKSGWNMIPGTPVLVTLPGVPNADGTSGWTDEPMVLVAVEPTYATAGDRPGSTLTLLHSFGGRTSTYSPTAELDLAPALVSGEYVLSLTSNAYSPTGSHDSDYFAVGDKVRVVNPALAETGAETGLEITAVAEDSITVSGGAFAGGPYVGWLLVYETWDTAVTAQQLHVFVADNNASLGAGNDDAFDYGA